VSHHIIKIDLLIPSLLLLGALLIYFTPLNFVLWFAYWAFMLVLFKKVENDIFSPLWIYFFYFFSYFAIRPGYYLLNEKEPFLFNIASAPDSVYAITLLFVSVSMFSFLVGYTIKFGSKKRIKKITYSSFFLNFIAISLQAIVMISAFYLIYHFGGVNNVLSLQSSLVQLIPLSEMHIKLAWIFVLISFLPLSLLLTRHGFSKSVFLVFAINMVFCLIFGRRLAIISLIIPLGIYFHYYKKRITVNQGILYFFALLIFLFINCFFIKLSKINHSFIFRSYNFFKKINHNPFLIFIKLNIAY